MGWRQPNSRIEAATLSIACSGILRAFLPYGVIFPSGHKVTFIGRLLSCDWRSLVGCCPCLPSFVGPRIVSIGPQVFVLRGVAFLYVVGAPSWPDSSQR